MNMKDNSKYKKIVIRGIVLCFWLIIWQLVSNFTGLELLLPGPLSVAKAITELLRMKSFYLTVITTFIRISEGFLIGFISGLIIGALAGFFGIVKTFLSPLIQIMKALPVVSFIILLLIWFGSSNVSVWISFIVVFPIIYTSTAEGIRNLDPSLSEMSDVFHMLLVRKIRYLYFPQIFPYVISGVTVALGMCWKAGISAEVIGLASNSIGSQMYYTKLYLLTADLFAWSIIVIIISFVFEKFFVWLLNLLKWRLEH